MDLTLILFDVDGTLVDSQAHIVAAMDRAFAQQGLVAPNRAAILSIVGLSLDQAFAQLCPDQSAAVRGQLVEGYKQAFADLRKTQTLSPLYPGVMAGLAAMNARANCVLGVATGKSKRGLDHIIDAHDLGGMFVTTQVADFHPSKPHPSMALTAMAEAGAERGVMIGDTTYDMQMGQAAGLKTIGVTWGYHSPDMLAPYSDVIVSDFAEISPALDRLWSTT